MSTLSSNHGRSHAAPAPSEVSLTSIGRAAAGPVASLAGRTASHTAGLAWRRVDRLITLTGFRDRHISTDDALAEDRRRIAADVHDLIMQDLSFALATARTLADDPASAYQASVVVTAGERALAGARDVMQGLVSRDGAKPVTESVQASARAAARSAPLKFEAMVDASVRADQPTVDTLVHVAREAVTNAVKHCGAQTPVEVLFERGEEWRLAVRDMGSGFDPSTAPTGFGLLSMHTRARELGGSLRVNSVPGRGTTVELTLP